MDLEADIDSGPLISLIPVPPGPGLLGAATLGAGLAVLVLGAASAPGFTVLASLAVVLAWLCTGAAKDALGWLRAPALRSVEYGILIGLGAAEGLGVEMFVLLWAVSYHHYDVVYRARVGHRAPEHWRRTALLGWDGRIALLVGGAVLGVLDEVVVALAAWFLAILVIESAVRSVATHRRGRRSDD